MFNPHDNPISGGCFEVFLSKILIKPTQFKYNYQDFTSAKVKLV